MNLWLAVDLDMQALGVEKSWTSEQAYYQFMKQEIYPNNLIKLPDSVIRRVDAHDNSVNDTGYHFSDRD